MTDEQLKSWRKTTNLMKGKLLIISGPSAGVGKDTIVKMFLEKHPNWQRPASVTTRKPRVGETEADYIFVDRSTFEKKVKAGEFLEWVETTGNLYGTLREPVERTLKAGNNVILRKDVRGALAIKKKLPKAITICLLPDEWEALERRFRQRATDSEELIQARLELAEEELTYKENFDHLIINPHNRPEDAVTAVEKAAGI